MIIQPESQISLFHSLVRIMYIMLNDIHGRRHSDTRHYPN